MYLYVCLVRDPGIHAGITLPKPSQGTYFRYQLELDLQHGEHPHLHIYGVDSQGEGLLPTQMEDEDDHEQNNLCKYCD